MRYPREIEILIFSFILNECTRELPFDFDFLLGLKRTRKEHITVGFEVRLKYLGIHAIS